MMRSASPQDMVGNTAGGASRMKSRTTRLKIAITETLKSFILIREFRIQISRFENFLIPSNLFQILIPSTKKFNENIQDIYCAKLWQNIAQRAENTEKNRKYRTAN
jgi:hypothetical protein